MKTLIQKLKRPFFSRPSLKDIKKEFIHTIGATSLTWQIAFFYIPIALLFAISFTCKDPITGTLKLSLTHFKPIMNITYYKVIFNSLALSLSTAIISLLIAFPLTYFIVFKTSRFRYLLLFFLLIPFWTNFLLHIYAWFFILEKNGLVNQLLMTIGVIKEPIQFLHTVYASLLLMVYYYIPFMALPIFSALERFNTSYYEASVTLGAGRAQTFSRIVFPIIQKSIISGFFLVFIAAFGEFLIPEFMGGDKIAYVGSVISLFLLEESTGPVGLAFTTLALTTLIICSALLYLLMKTLFNYLEGASHDQS
jgi:spermidine/putrescine transport system permease protein